MLNEAYQISTLISIIIGVSGGILLYYYLRVLTRYERRRITENEKQFRETLLEGLKTGSITIMDDVINVYKGIAGLSSEDLSFRYSLSRQLRKFLVDLISKNIDNSIDESSIVDWKQKISEFIRANEEISPYADLPPTERNVLSDISSFIESRDTESTKRKLLELAGMIQARYDDLNRISKINKWSVPLSIIGISLTIIFGIFGVILIFR